METNLQQPPRLSCLSCPTSSRPRSSDGGLTRVFTSSLPLSGSPWPLMMVLAEATLAGGRGMRSISISPKRLGQGATAIPVRGRRRVSGPSSHSSLGLLWPRFMEFAGPIIGIARSHSRGSRSSPEGDLPRHLSLRLGSHTRRRAHLWGRRGRGGEAGWASGISSSSFANSLDERAPAGFALVNGQAVNVDPIAAMAQRGGGVANPAT